ncbi:MAG: lipoyl(octanoyl) transferase LipB [Ignavibacteriales bacterium]|nr:lipoyl(octanoyl) transferase LipB [Ignavibacteriales bacterium]
MKSLAICDIGRTRYADAWALQKSLWELRKVGLVGDTLLLTEHAHVYTLGKGSDDNHLLATEQELSRDGVEVFHIDRGGDVTYHGPGQIVGYPILDLNNYFLDIHRYLRSIEEAVILTLETFGIRAQREEEMTGVWVGSEKIAAIGVKVSRWITMHGFALNVNTDLQKFGRIIPCGIFHKGVTSMQKILGREVDLKEVQEHLTRAFARVFGAELTSLEAESLHAKIASMEVNVHS